MEVMENSYKELSSKNSAQEVLLEIMFDEAPCAEQANLAQAIYKNLIDNLDKNNISFESINTSFAPGRIYIIIQKVEYLAADELIKGPNVNLPESAKEGFARKFSIDSKDLLRLEEDNNYFWFIKKESISIGNSLKSVFEKTLTDIQKTFSDYWFGPKTSWIRPVRNLLFLIDGSDTTKINFCDLTSSRFSLGRITDDRRKIPIDSYKNYEEAMLKAGIIVDAKKRIENIRNKLQLITDISAKSNIEDKIILESNNPNILKGRIREKFDLPCEEIKEIIMSSVNAIPLYDNEDEGVFIAVADCNKITEEIIKGREKAVAAALRDASSLWAMDKKLSEQDCEEVIANRKSSGNGESIVNKIDRIAALTKYASVWIPGTHMHMANDAAKFSKISSIFSLVVENPDTHGLVAKSTALRFKKCETIALAAEESSMPRKPSDPTPESPLGIAVAIADKIDDIAGFFLSGKQFKGSEDPFGIRRIATALTRILVERKVRVPLDLITNKALHLRYSSNERSDLKKSVINKLKFYNLKQGSRPVIHSQSIKHKEVHESILDFIKERLLHVMKEQGIDEKMIYAALNKKENIPPSDALDLGITLTKFFSTEEGQQTLASFKRLSGIIKSAEKKIGNISCDSHFRKELLEKKEESDLFKMIESAGKSLTEEMAATKWDECLMILASLTEYINSFLDKVPILQSDTILIQNRIVLIRKTIKLFDKIANFSMLL